MYTVITPKLVFRIKGRSIQHVTQALHNAGIAFIGIHEDKAAK